MRPNKELFEAVIKENLRTYQRKSKYGKPILIKLLKLFNYSCNQMEELNIYMRPNKELFEAVIKENLRTYQRKSKYGKPILIKSLKLFSYWCNQMEELTTAVMLT